MNCQEKTIGTEDNPERINAFDFLRVTGMLMVFWGHVWAFLPFSSSPDLGGRAVDLFFLLSGFLFAYNYYNKELKTTPKACASFAYSHIKKYYCLHVITAALMFFKLYITGSIDFKLDGGYGKGAIINFVLNLLLLQSWVPNSDYYFGFNGVAWFLSSLIFCYFLFPILLKYVKKSKNIAELGIFAGGGALLLAIIQTAYSVEHPAESYYYCYIFPPYRAIWFFIGCIVGVLFLGNRVYLKASALGRDSTCVIAVLLYGLSVYFCNSSWNSAEYLIPTILMIFIVACCSGKLETAFSCRMIKWLSKLSFEFYLIHHVVVVYYSFMMGSIHSLFEGTWLTDVAVQFGVSILLSVAYFKIKELADKLLFKRNISFR